MFKQNYDAKLVTWLLDSTSPSFTLARRLGKNFGSIDSATVSSVSYAEREAKKGRGRRRRMLFAGFLSVGGQDQRTCPFNIQGV
jgi:hypothetical protein